MKQSNVTEGMQVVVNTNPDAVLYTVKKVDERMVTLVYYTNNGMECHGGQVDISLIMTPSQRQLKNAFGTMCK